MATTDFLVVGGGIIGVSIARELRRRHSDRSVTVLEKEPACGRHASGRNSGVLHAGFYYSADSLKAKFTRDGNRALVAYCDAREAYYRRLVTAKPDLEVFLKGWLNRLDSLRREGGLTVFGFAGQAGPAEAGPTMRIPDLGEDPGFDI